MESQAKLSIFHRSIAASSFARSPMNVFGCENLIGRREKTPSFMAKQSDVTMTYRVCWVRKNIAHNRWSWISADVSMNLKAPLKSWGFLPITLPGKSVMAKNIPLAYLSQFFLFRNDVLCCDWPIFFWHQ